MSSSKSVVQTLTMILKNFVGPNMRMSMEVGDFDVRCWSLTRYAGKLDSQTRRLRQRT